MYENMTKQDGMIIKCYNREMYRKINSEVM